MDENSVVEPNAQNALNRDSSIIPGQTLSDIQPYQTDSSMAAPQSLNDVGTSSLMNITNGRSQPEPVQLENDIYGKLIILG